MLEPASRQLLRKSSASRRGPPARRRRSPRTRRRQLIARASLASAKCHIISDTSLGAGRRSSPSPARAFPIGMVDLGETARGVDLGDVAGVSFGHGHLGRRETEGLARRAADRHDDAPAIDRIDVTTGTVGRIARVAGLAEVLACILNGAGLVAASENGPIARRRKPQPDRVSVSLSESDRSSLETCKRFRGSARPTRDPS